MRLIEFIKSEIENGVTKLENSKAIYEQVGNCKIVIGNEEFAINATNAEDKVSELRIVKAGKYEVKLMTESGNTISMFVVTKKDPLNAFSIILIVVGSIVLIAGGIIFYRLRINMKIK